MRTLSVDHKWTETVTVDGASEERERSVHLVIGGPADLEMGIRRSLLMEEQRIFWEEEKNKLVGDGYKLIDLVAVEILRTQMYPSLLAAVVEQEGFDDWPIVFERFKTLPEALGVKWEEAVNELNPHWAPTPEPESLAELEEARKKAMDGTSELSNG